jgi:hypothetical protein
LAQASVIQDKQKQAWIHSPAVDLSVIILPAFIISALVIVFQPVFSQIDELPVWLWALLIVGVDVAHVYGTLFRTYFNPVEFEQRKALLVFVPILCWLTGMLIYSVEALFFWRALAYLAVFHFVRQQYGFMAIYSRNEPTDFRRFRWLDTLVIYLSMLYPLAYWHVHLPRHFNWFMEWDFLSLPFSGLDLMLAALLSLLGGLYLLKEIYLYLKSGFLNIPRNLIIAGTAVSWAIGIVVFNNDLIFTATNVISHGIPYMALVWISGRRASELQPDLPVVSRLSHQRFFSMAWVPLFILLLGGFAYLEEGLWDGLVWQEHTDIFALFALLPRVSDSETLTWLVPLLALPQATHYVLDGFIWRMKTGQSNWSAQLLELIPMQKAGT